MATASLPSPSFHVQTARRSRAQITNIGWRRERWRQHPLQRTAAARWHGLEISLRPLCIGQSTSHGEPHPTPLSPSPSNMIKDFYSSINDKNMKLLDKLIADGCVFEDLAFPKPFVGKKEVRWFLKELTQAMGKHMRFSIEGAYEGGETFVGVIWHLEWKEEAIPFTKGCSFFECSRDGEKLLIKRARIFVESPVKPGEFVLELLKIISSLLDKFPKLAEKFLQKPNVMIQLIVKAYKIFVEPLILPVLVYYTHLWTFAARILSYALAIVQKLLKFLM